MSLYLGARTVEPGRSVRLYVGSSLVFDPTPPLYLGDCSVAYADLERITAAEAIRRGTISGCLVMGSVAAAAITATDCVIESRASVETTVRGGSTLTRVMVSALEREEDGTPLRIWRTRQHLGGSGYTLKNVVLEWMNDGHTNAHHSLLEDVTIGPHANYIFSGDRQHPDGIQSYGHGGLVARRIKFINKAMPAPLGRDGLPVPFMGRSVDDAGKSYPGPAGAASIMLNEDYPYVDPVVLEDLESSDSASVHLNLGTGSWQLNTHANGEPMLTVRNVLIKGDPATVVRANRTTLSRMFPNSRSSWSWDGGNWSLGQSSALSLVAEDGTVSTVLRNQVVWT